MGLAKRISIAAEEAKGKVKAAIGKATGNRRLEAEGKTDQTKARMKKAANKIKGTIRDALD